MFNALTRHHTKSSGADTSGADYMPLSDFSDMMMLLLCLGDDYEMNCGARGSS
jgi:hypothetical protein